MKTGDTVYSAGGEEAEYIAAIEGRHCIRRIYEDGNGNPRADEPVIVNEVFETPPIERKEVRVRELEKQIEVLEARKRELDAELRTSKEDDKARKLRVMQHDALCRIDDFLSGKFTHFTYFRYSDVRIVTFDEAIHYKENEYERVPTGMRLLTLYGKANGDLSWHISDYSDGSGSLKEVVPHQSLESAIADASSRIDKQYAEWRASENRGAMYPVSNAVKSAIALGLPVPADVAEAIKKHELKILENAHAKSLKDFQEAEAKLIAARVKV